ncbi:hypothetical protein HJ588_07995 [Flexivirga sp. ID2601S]|uniref:Uncharacterized protein n=1 Tax=Flexivirga aerilata TaxID=1656889 RepID=A0A849AEC2_9MICO|nr:hypothetical protein [Flexivirga aerilata]NNG39214.1 hypothetical protein [Flexivirga aerilata]
MTDRSRGRHRAAGSAGGGAKGGWLVAAVIAVLLAAGIGGWAFGVNRDNSPTNAGSSSSGETAPAPDGASDTTSPGTDTSPTGDAGASAALTGCRAKVAAGDSLAKAADAVYKDWSGHVYTQIDYDAGKVSEATAKKVWADTKAAGPGHVKTFDSDKTAYDKAAGCDGTASVPAADRTPMEQCSNRASALAKVASTGSVLNSQWKEHQVQMTHTMQKQHDPSAYYGEWFNRISAAKKPLKDYESAAAALKKAPSCPGA